MKELITKKMQCHGFFPKHFTKFSKMLLMHNIERFLYQ